MTVPTGLHCVCTWGWAPGDSWYCVEHGPITMLAVLDQPRPACRNPRHDHTVHQGGASCDRTPRPYPPEHVAIGWAVYVGALIGLAAWAGIVAAYDRLRGKL